MARTLPPMMQVLKDVGGVEFPDTFANFTGNNHPATAETKHNSVPAEEKKVPGTKFD